MNYKLHSVERIVAQIGDPLQCFIRANQNDLSKLNWKGNFDLKKKLLTLSTSSKAPKIINNKIMMHQTRASHMLNILEKKKFYCQSRCEMFERCKKDIIGPLIIDLYDILKFIYKNFPYAFNFELKAPQRVYGYYADVISSSTIMLYTPPTDDENFKILKEPFVDFLNHKKKKYTYRNIEYLIKLLEIIEDITPQAITFNKMVDICIYRNVNSSKVYKYIVNQFEKNSNVHDDFALKAKYFAFLKSWIEEADCKSPNGYVQSRELLKHSLISWIKREYNFLYYKMHIVSPNSPVLKEHLSESSPKIKTNFSVSQLACFIKYLIEKDIIITDNKRETITQIAYVFTSKNSGMISHKSLLNKFFNSDEASQKYIQKVFLELSKSTDV